MADIDDFFGKASIDNNYAIATTVKTTRTAGVTVLEAFDLSKFTDDTPVFFVTYKKTTDPLDPTEVIVSDLVSYKALVNTGANTLTNIDVAPGYTDIGNDVGDFIECIPTSYWVNNLIDGIFVGHNPDGTFKTSAVKAALGITSDPTGGWSVLNAGTAPTVASGYNKGNKSFDLTFAGVDLTNTLSSGMRFRVERGTTAPTQCMDLERSSSQFAQDTTVSGISSTDDITCEAWVKLESYPGVAQGVVTRYNGTSGFEFRIGSTGTVDIVGFNAGASNFRIVNSNQSIPLGEWVHIAGTLDMSGWTAATNKIYINGVDVPALLTSSGSNPTAFIQAGNLQVGASNGGSFFDGKIADVRLWSDIRTETEIRDNMNQQLTGSETNLVGYWQLDGDLNDSTANANHMAGSGGAVATDVDNPMNDTEYAIIQSVTYSAPDTTINVFTGKAGAIPNLTLTSPYYSTQKTPFGFPASRGNWRVESIFRSTQTKSIPAVDTWAPSNSKLTVGMGAWRVGFEGAFLLESTVAGNRAGNILMSNTTINPPTNGIENIPLSGYMYEQSGNFAYKWLYVDSYHELAAQDTYTLTAQITNATGIETWSVKGDSTSVTMFAENGYL